MIGVPGSANIAQKIDEVALTAYIDGCIGTRGPGESPSTKVAQLQYPQAGSGQLIRDCFVRGSVSGKGRPEPPGPELPFVRRERADANQDPLAPTRRRRHPEHSVWIRERASEAFPGQGFPSGAWSLLPRCCRFSRTAFAEKFQFRQVVILRSVFSSAAESMRKGSAAPKSTTYFSHSTPSGRVACANCPGTIRGNPSRIFIAGQGIKLAAEPVPRRRLWVGTANCRQSRVERPAVGAVSDYLCIQGRHAKAARVSSFHGDMRKRQRAVRWLGKLAGAADRNLGGVCPNGGSDLDGVLAMTEIVPLL